MSTISQRSCQTDLLITEAGLRGIKAISYNQRILSLMQDLDLMREIMQRNNIKELKAVKDLESKIQAMERQATEWITDAGYQAHRDYAITILIEEVK